MDYINQNVARYLTDIPIECLVHRIAIQAGECDGKIEKEPLKSFIVKEVRALRQSIPASKYPDFTRPQAHAVIQELLSQHYLTFSEENPFPDKLYFEPTQKARDIRF